MRVDRDSAERIDSSSKCLRSIRSYRTDLDGVTTEAKSTTTVLIRNHLPSRLVRPLTKQPKIWLRNCSLLECHYDIACETWRPILYVGVSNPLRVFISVIYEDFFAYTNILDSDYLYDTWSRHVLFRCERVFSELHVCGFHIH
jgi:hypothetical protein